MLAVVAGVGLGVLFALLGIVGVFGPSGLTIGLGLAGISFVIAALLYIFYMRGTAVSRTGYATVIAILAIALIIPLLTITQQQSQADQAKMQYDLTLRRGAALFGQYCAPCHNYQGQGLIGPQLNGEGAGLPAVYTLTDQEITRTISGGVPDPSKINTYLMPAWLNTYGGPLTQEDISYLLALIRSSEPSYRDAQAKAGTPLPSDVNGFDYVVGTLSQSQLATATALSKPQKPDPTTFKDLTGQKNVTIAAYNDTGSAGTFHWAVQGDTLSNIIISAGTTITWTNASNTAHNVYSGYGTFDASPPPDGFKSGLLNTAANGGGTFTFTYSAAGEYQYFCGIHPYMKGWITVK
jgi:plastocyanin/mono/diheme cytochrome c family protein